MAHKCDPTLLVTTQHNPLTVARMLRMLLAWTDVDGDQQGQLAAVLEELGGCSVCMTGVLCAALGVARDALLQSADREHVIAHLDRHLAALLDEPAEGNGEV